MLPNIDFQKEGNRWVHDRKKSKLRQSIYAIKMLPA